MATRMQRCSFIAFHLTLGLVLLVLSVRTVVEAMAGAGPARLHAVVGALEALGAVLFLVPRSLRIGGALLLLTIGLVIVLHALVGQLRGDLLVYATGTWYVMVHGPAWGGSTPSAAA